CRPPIERIRRWKDENSLASLSNLRTVSSYAQITGDNLQAPNRQYLAAVLSYPPLQPHPCYYDSPEECPAWTPGQPSYAESARQETSDPAGRPAACPGAPLNSPPSLRSETAQFPIFRFVPYQCSFLQIFSESNCLYCFSRFEKRSVSFAPSARNPKGSKLSSNNRSTLFCNSFSK